MIKLNCKFICFLGIISLLETFPAVFSQEQINSLLKTFATSIQKSHEDIIELVPEWHEYAYNFENITNGDDQEQNLLSNEVTFQRGKREKDENYETRSSAFNESIRSPAFDYATIAIHPFVALMWIRETPEASTDYSLQVSQDLVDGDETENKSISIEADDLRITFSWYQNVRNTHPTLCKVFFSIQGFNQSWNSSAEFSPNFLRTSVSITLQPEPDEKPRNILLGFILLSRSAGEAINNSDIEEVIRRLLKTFPRVLCNPSLELCESNEFDCRCGGDISRYDFPEPHCIPNRWRCDGTPDCPDGRDEESCQCEEGFFQCGCDEGGDCDVRFQCIPMEKVCNGIQDCNSFKDERTGICAFNCTKFGEQIRDVFQCDGKRDCMDFSDEENCTMIPDHLPNRCHCNTVEKFTCSNETGNYSLYSNEERCNGIKRCSDFSDEWNCTCPVDRPNPCNCSNSGNFTCDPALSQHSCYTQEERCDRHDECSDRTDEIDCTAVGCFGTKSFACRCNDYNNPTCNGSTACFGEEDKCDGWIDCIDGLDEENCTECPTYLPRRCNCGADCPPFETFTYMGRHQEPLTINVAFSCFSEWDACNGENNCFDGSDENEKMCSTCPDERPFACDCHEEENCVPGHDTPCYSKIEKCNGIPDCKSVSDERYCPCTSKEAPFECACRNEKTPCFGKDSCYNASQRCDGKQACENWSDELACEHCPPAFPKRCLCNTGNNTCRNGRACVAKNEFCDGQLDCSDGSDESVCKNCTNQRPFPCDCNKNGMNCETGSPPCFNDTERCNGVAECSDRTDENNCTICPNLRPNHCFCNTNNSVESCKNNSLMCYTNDQTCDGKKDCASGSDEWNCMCSGQKNEPCNCKSFTNSSVCVGETSCYDGSGEKCNGVINCHDASDEWNCPCDSSRPYKCACKMYENSNVCVGLVSCFSEQEKCNAVADCADGVPTDEANCTCPPNKTFSCECYRTINRTCGKDQGCIAAEKMNNGIKDCTDGSDEPYLTSFQFMQCDDCSNITWWRFSNISACYDIRYPSTCDPDTCKAIPSVDCKNDLSCKEKDYICFSNCNGSDENCRQFFQCQDHSLIPASQFCDGIQHCNDGTDEIRSGFGFLCDLSENSTFSCVIPQWNLDDDNIPQCYNDTDLDPLFSCMDQSLKISREQVCDGIVNCQDLSDECLCRDSLESEVCRFRFPGHLGNIHCQPIDKSCDDKITSTHIAQLRCSNQRDVESSQRTCISKFGEVVPTPCNGVPECSDFSDECDPSCAIVRDIPKFCNDTCHDFYLMGDRYCNGYNDDAFSYLDDPSCPRGFDELQDLCPERFRCKAGRQVSIPIEQKDDNIRHCDDGSDESVIFSSDEEMISNDGIRYAIWIIAFITLAGNAYVIVSTGMLIRSKKLHEMMRVNHILILNLAAADFLMGIYLLIVSIRSAQYSGRYGFYDLEWRSSVLCSTAGSLAIISSETSVLIMTALSSFRLVNVLAPLKSLSFPTWPWFFLIGFLWLISFILAAFPGSFEFSDYFVYQVFFNLPFARNRTLTREQLITVGCRYASLSNSTFVLPNDYWEDVLLKAKQLFPEPPRQVGYYGETSLCMPRFYVGNTENAAAFSLAIVSINFIAFVYVCLSYVVIYKITTNRPMSNKQVDQQNARMQKRIARLLATDFICWIPICIIAFAKASLGDRLNLPNDLYAITIAFLLPVNSALNPILYSTFFETMISKISCVGKKKDKSSKGISKVTSSERSDSLTVTQNSKI